MHYDLKNTKGQLRPRATLVLDNLGNRPLYHSIRGLRHPLGIFNFTFGEVIAKTTKLLDLLENAAQTLPYLDQKRNGWDQELLDATDHFLDAIMQHLDGFKSIIGCFFEDCGSKSAQKVLRSLSREIREYRDHVASIVNSIKHEQRRLSSIFFHNPGLFVVGYFVEGVLPNGAIGPDPKIHHGSNVAISYNRDLPFHFCNIYYTASVLAQHIHTICGVTPKENPSTSNSDEALEKVLKRVAVLPMIFFPDEIRKPVPLIRCNPKLGDDLRVEITLEMPSKRFKARSIPPGCQIRTTWHGDGVAQTFKVPYMGQDAPN